MTIHKVDEWTPLVVAHLSNELGEAKFKKLVDLLQTHKGLIAGGSILKAITNFNSTQNNAERNTLKNDIDIYVNTNQIPEFLTKLQNEIIKPTYNTVYWAANYCLSFLRKNGIRRVYQFDEIGKLKIDVMSVRNKRKVLDVVTNFDLTFCQVWFDGKDVYTTHPEDIRKKEGSLQKDYVRLYYSGNKFLNERISKSKLRGVKVSSAIHRSRKLEMSARLPGRRTTSSTPNCSIKASSLGRSVPSPRIMTFSLGIFLDNSAEALIRNGKFF